MGFDAKLRRRLEDHNVEEDVALSYVAAPRLHGDRFGSGGVYSGPKWPARCSIASLGLAEMDR